MHVREVMTPAVKIVAASTPLPVVARIMRDEDIGVVAVAENERLVGMVTDRDIVVRGLADGEAFTGRSAAEVMSPRVLYCLEDQSVEDVLRNMSEQQVRRLAVVDKDKRLVGVVSLGDLSVAAQTAASGASLRGISTRQN